MLFLCCCIPTLTVCWLKNTPTQTHTQLHIDTPTHTHHFFYYRPPMDSSACENDISALGLLTASPAWISFDQFLAWLLFFGWRNQRKRWPGHAWPGPALSSQRTRRAHSTRAAATSSFYSLSEASFPVSILLLRRLVWSYSRLFVALPCETLR